MTALRRNRVYLIRYRSVPFCFLKHYYRKLIIIEEEDKGARAKRCKEMLSLIRDGKLEIWQIKGLDANEFAEFQKELNLYLKNFSVYQDFARCPPELELDRVLDFRLKEWVASLSEPPA